MHPKEDLREVNKRTVIGLTRIEAGTSSAHIFSPDLGFNDVDVKTLLGDVPDGELKQYLEEHGGANDIATN